MCKKCAHKKKVAYAIAMIVSTLAYYFIYTQL